MWCGEGAIKPTPTPGLMAWWRRIHGNATSIQIHNYNVNKNGAIWSILGTGSPGFSAFIARMDCCCVNGNCAFNTQSRHSCVNNNGAFMALWRRHVSLLQCEKGINHIQFMPRLACKPFGDIHSICPQANTPILVLSRVALQSENLYSCEQGFPISFVGENSTFCKGDIFWLSSMKRYCSKICSLFIKSGIKIILNIVIFCWEICQYIFFMRSKNTEG